MRRSITVTALIIITCIGVAVATTRPKTTTDNISPSETPHPVSVEPSPPPAFDNTQTDQEFKELFQDLLRVINNSSDPREFITDQYAYVWWISDTGYNVISKPTETFTAQYYCEGIDKSFETAKKVLPPRLTAIMKKHGYAVNTANTSRSLEDTRFYDYVQAYEKGNTKCTLTLNPECSGTGEEDMATPLTVACTTDYSKNRSVQEPMLRDLGITDAVATIQEQVGEYAKLNVHYRRTGHYAIVVKRDDRWVELYAGQDIPPCDIMRENGVPQELYGQCFDGTAIY